MHPGVKWFVGIVFAIIGASFLVTTATLAWEFWGAGALALASFYSHLFLFFPTFGIVTLLAFYTPACVLTDIYWKKVDDPIPAGRTRFTLVSLALVAASIGASYMMTSGQERSVFEVAPGLLVSDRGNPDACSERGSCRRLPVLQAVENVRTVSQFRTGLTDLARNCKPDALKDPVPGALPPKRYCFASSPLPPGFDGFSQVERVSDEDCCRSQRLFTDAVAAFHARPQGQSLTGLVHSYTLWLKVFFALVLLAISLLLLVRHDRMVHGYGDHLSAVERGVLVGATAMIVYPLMSHAFVQSSALLYFGAGPSGGYRSIAPLLSFVLGLWGLVLLFFFYRRQGERVQNIARMAGIVGSGIAVVKYDQIIDYCVRLFGSGAGLPNVVAMVIVAVVAGVLLSMWSNRETLEAERKRAQGDTQHAAAPGGEDQRPQVP